MLLGGDRAHSELSNRGSGLKIGPFLTEIQPLFTLTQPKIVRFSIRSHRWKAQDLPAISQAYGALIGDKTVTKSVSKLTRTFQICSVDIFLR